MEPVRARLVATLFVLLAAIAPAYAQVEATIVGTVADESKAVLPGVTVTAADLATGRQFTDVTDVRGEYRLVGMQAGKDKVEAEVAGFAPFGVSEVEMLVGQNATVVFLMKGGSIEETLTVSAAAPLVDTRPAHGVGNV